MSLQLLAGKEIRHYVLKKLIKKGGMGEVWEARDLHRGEDVALKAIDSRLLDVPGFVERFMNVEARVHSRLEHENIVPVYDSFIEDERCYLVMRLIPGGSLSDKLDATPSRRLDEPQAIRIACDMLDALNFAHQKGVIHRDVKPGNLLLDTTGRAYLTDFGIALALGDERKTSTGVAVGTPHYMSPEQIQRPRNLDHRTDVYSAGCVLYEMLTGRTVFVSKHGDESADFEIKRMHVQEEPDPPIKHNPNIRPGLSELVMKALEKDPNLRFGGCGEFAQKLRNPTQNGPPPDHPRRPWWIYVLVAIVALLLFGLGFQAYRHYRQWMVAREFENAMETAHYLKPLTGSAFEIYDRAEQDNDPVLPTLKRIGRPKLRAFSDRVFQFWRSESELLPGFEWEDMEHVHGWLIRMGENDRKFLARQMYCAGQAALVQERYLMARDRFEESLKLKLGWAISLNGIGKACVGLNDYGCAVYYYEQAIGADPEWVFPYVNLAGVFRTKGDYPRSSDYLRKAIKLKPEKAAYHYHLATTLQAGLGPFNPARPPEICQEFREACRLATKGRWDPRDPWHQCLPELVVDLVGLKADNQVRKQMANEVRRQIAKACP